MASRQEKTYFAAVLPWLRLPRQAEVGPVRFTPVWADSIPAALASLDEDTLAALRLRISVYRGVRGHPVTPWSIATLGGQNPLAEPDAEGSSDIRLARDLLCFACLAENEYYTESDRYVNATCFHMHWSRFVVGDDLMAFAIPRRGRSGWSSGYRCGAVAVSEPLQCTMVSQVNWDHGFLQALWSACHPSSGDDSSLRIAVECFNETHSDDPWASPERQVVVAASALEYLTGKGKQQAMANAAVEHLGAYSGPGIRSGRPCRVGQESFIGEKINSRNSQDTIPEKSRPVYYWLRELHCRRSHIVHPFRERAKWVWSDQQHLALLAFVFPLIVKCMLASKCLYGLTSNDRVRLDAVDELVALQRPHDTDRGSQQSRWQTTMNRAKWRRADEETGLSEALMGRQ